MRGVLLPSCLSLALLAHQGHLHAVGLRVVRMLFSAFVRFSIFALKDTRILLQQAVRLMGAVVIVLVQGAAVGAFEFHRLVLCSYLSCCFSACKGLAAFEHGTHAVLFLQITYARSTKILIAIIV